MVVPAAPEHFPRLAQLWLEASLTAHDFVDASYWIANQSAMQEQYLPQSEVQVCQDDGEIVGFAAMVGDDLASLFIDPKRQGRGYGRLLLEQVKTERESITLNVFVKNTQACAFYQKNGFEVVAEQIDEATGEREWRMVWRRIQSEQS
ncbi:hypothetical protein B9G55_13145 [Saccharibacillus sp. O16]|nr:hypothetical protein B9G55_13145 [Saccharibacillus sp. O16]